MTVRRRARARAAPAISRNQEPKQADLGEGVRSPVIQGRGVALAAPRSWFAAPDNAKQAGGCVSAPQSNLQVPALIDIESALFRSVAVAWMAGPSRTGPNPWQWGPGLLEDTQPGSLELERSAALVAWLAFVAQEARWVAAAALVARLAFVAEQTWSYVCGCGRRRSGDSQDRHRSADEYPCDSSHVTSFDGEPDENGRCHRPAVGDCLARSECVQANLSAQLGHWVGSDPPQPGPVVASGCQEPVLRAVMQRKSHRRGSAR